MAESPCVLYMITFIFHILCFIKTLTTVSFQQLEVVGPGGPPDGHGDEDDHEHHHH